MRTVFLYTRAGCHLCDEAAAILDQIRAEGAELDVVPVDIEKDEALHATYLERIPVVEVDGRVISELVPKERALRRSLDTLGT